MSLEDVERQFVNEKKRAVHEEKEKGLTHAYRNLMNSKVRKKDFD